MRPTIDQIRGLGDFATLVNWDLQFVSLPSGISAGSQDLNLRCESTDVPKSTGQSTQIQIRGLPPVKQPGLYIPSGTIALVFNETVDNTVSKLITQWREMCYEMKTGKQKKKSEVEAQIRLVRMDRQDKEIYEYMLYGAFLEDYDTGGQLGAASADVVKPSLTLSYDYFEEKAL